MNGEDFRRTPGPCKCPVCSEGMKPAEFEYEDGVASEDLRAKYEAETGKPDSIQEMWIPENTAMPSWDYVRWLEKRVSNQFTAEELDAINHDIGGTIMMTVLPTKKAIRQSILDKIKGKV